LLSGLPLASVSESSQHHDNNGPIMERLPTTPHDAVGRQVEARNIAQKMLARGLELDLIMHLTGLTQEELVALAH